MNICNWFKINAERFPSKTALICEDQDYPLERLMRDAKHLRITDGSNEIQRALIARTLDY
jgi:hypothetical protein